MLDMGFEPDVRRILEYLTEDSISRLCIADSSSPPNAHVQRNVPQVRQESCTRLLGR